MEEAEEEVLAYLAFPPEHWRQLWSTNPLEWLNWEVERRTHVVGIFPSQAGLICLVGLGLAEQHEEWQMSRRQFSAESLAKLNEEAQRESMPALLMAS